MAKNMFDPNFKLSKKLLSSLTKIESLKQEIENLPITPSVLKSLRESARLLSTHYSTMIEGNRLTQEQVVAVITTAEHFLGRERDEKEVLGYYAALNELEKWVAQKTNLNARLLAKLHALVMSEGKKRIKSTPYRDGQNVIKDSSTRKIVYLPPEAKDVPNLMDEMITLG